VKRYNHEYFGPGDDPGGNMNDAEDGDWVRYEDHAAALAEAQAECERLRAQLAIVRDEGDEAREERNAAESKLAAAEALLGRVKARENDIWDEDLVADITAHLAGAAAPARSESMQAQSTSEFALAEAEQRVLDAIAELDESVLDWWWVHGSVCQSNVAVAERARRGLKP
jgi:chromosome segregation ATPase